jgi:nucleotide-binding universal stress UspA family protein
LNRIVVAEELEMGDAQARKRSRWLRQYGTWLAGKLKAPLELVHAEPETRLSQYPQPYPDYARKHLAAAKRLLLKLARESACEANFLIGEPAEKLLTYLHSGGRRYSLLATGTHGRTGIRRLLLGSVAEELVRGAKVPVLVLGPKTLTPSNATWAMRSGPPILLVATDLSAEGRAVDRFAAALAKRLNASVRLIHGFNARLPMVAYSEGIGGAEMFAALNQQARDEARRELHARAKEYRRHGLRAVQALEQGGLSPAAFILKQARRATLLVLGRHSRGRLSRAFFGSTAREVFLHSPLPVISVPS